MQPYDGNVPVQLLPQRSAAWYPSVLAIGVVFERYANYLWFEEPIFKGQPANVITSFAFFGVALVLWLLAPRTRRADGLLLAFLIGMSAAWLVHWGLYRFHGDALNYTAILYVPMLLLIAFKPPNVAEARTATLSLAWAVTAVLLITFILEQLGLLAVKSQAPYVVEFDEERYFLPINELLGIDGRWPGPFGHNGDTAMMAALIIVIAVAFWSRSSWVFLAVGAFALVITNGRASIGAAAAGFVLLFMFSRSPRLRGIKRVWRIVSGSALLILGGLIMFARPAGLTGRENIWPAFLELWWQSPLVGVGGQGIASGNEIAQLYGHAHSLYIDELARWGLAGFLTQFTAIGIGVFVAARAAGVGYPGPVAVIVTYLITGITEPRNNWIAPSATGFLLILMAVSAAAYLNARSRSQEVDQDTDHSEASVLTNTRGADESPGDAKSGSLG